MDVRFGAQPVDLGLPSGTLWAKTNLGATKETDFGLYYQWGDMKGYSGVDEHQFNWDDYKWGNYDNLTKYNSEDGLTVLENSDDAIWTATDGVYKIPTEEQIQELLSGTTHEWVTIDDVNGMKFWKKGTEEPTDGNSYIFIPAAGRCYNGNYSGDENNQSNIWGISISDADKNNACAFYCTEKYTGIYFPTRCNGYSIRGVLS